MAVCEVVGKFGILLTSFALQTKNYLFDDSEAKEECGESIQGAVKRENNRVLPKIGTNIIKMGTELLYEYMRHSVHTASELENVKKGDFVPHSKTVL